MYSKNISNELVMSIARKCTYRYSEDVPNQNHRSNAEEVNRVTIDTYYVCSKLSRCLYAILYNAYIHMQKYFVSMD